jgi:hypothetical protein
VRLKPLSQLTNLQRYGKKKALQVQGYFHLIGKKAGNCFLFVHSCMLIKNCIIAHTI